MATSRQAAAPAAKKTRVAPSAAPAPASAPAAKKGPAAAAKKTAGAPAGKSAAGKSAAVAAKKAAGASSPSAAASATPKPIKDALNKTALIAHLAEQSQVEPRAVKAVMAALESTMLASLHKKGHGEFTLHGLLKVSASSVPAKKKRFGKDPFSGQERWFAAKPASTKIKTRALKKLKDAVL